ncbi:MAG: biotin/lipoyl-binding protein [bacterium]
MKKIVLVVGVIIALVSALLFAKRGNDPKVTLPLKAIPEYVSAEGKVEVMPGFEVEVGSELEGRLSEFPKDEGSNIKKGDLIAKIDDKELLARLKEAGSELSLAKARLKEAGSGARAEEIRKAEAVLSAASIAMDYAKIDPWAVANILWGMLNGIIINYEEDPVYREEVVGIELKELLKTGVYIFLEGLRKKVTTHKI